MRMSYGLRLAHKIKKWESLKYVKPGFIKAIITSFLTKITFMRYININQLSKYDTLKSVNSKIYFK